jgi:hypothetical protein
MCRLVVSWKLPYCYVQGNFSDTELHEMSAEEWTVGYNELSTLPQGFRVSVLLNIAFSLFHSCISEQKYNFNVVASTDICRLGSSRSG